MDSHILPVALDKAYRLLNHGPTVLVPASFDGVDNAMAAAWSCPLDFSPSKLTVVLDRSTMTRELAEKSGHFVIQVPAAAQLQLTHELGSRSLHREPEKLARCGATLFRIDGAGAPLVAGCLAWLACKIVPEPHIQATYDLFIGEVTAAWADSRVFKNGHWDFEHAGPDRRSLHYIAGGHFYAIGEPLVARLDGAE